MAQARYFDFKDPDSTQNMNVWYRNAAPQGLHGGADFIPTSNMNLTISAPRIVTQDGVLIVEDENIVVAVSTTSGSSRVDAILLQHNYNPSLVGGAAAVYVVSQGVTAETFTPASNQTLIGYLYLPSFCTRLDVANIYWRKEPAPKADYKYTLPAIDTNLNNLFEEKNYYLRKNVGTAIGAINFPANVTTSFLQIVRVKNDMYLQTFINFEDGRVYQRIYGYNNWGPWRYLANDTDLFNLEFTYAAISQIGFTQLYQTVQYMKDTLGFVHLRGVESITPYTVMNFGTLPVGFRPQQNERFFVCLENTNSIDIYLEIQTNGVVSTNNTGSPSQNNIYFGYISFYSGF